LPALLAIAVFASLASSATAAPSKVESGPNASCYLESGGAYCWVGGFEYSTPTGGPVTSKPTLFPGLTSGVTAISLSENTGCAVVSGAAKCWGTGFSGELGTWDHWSAFVPVPVEGLSSGVTDISAAYGYSCAVASGAVQCWGDSEENGYALNDDSYPSLAHTIPTLTSGATAVETGDEMACAIVSGAVKCWGSGYLGDGSDHFTPGIATVTGLTASVTALEVDGRMACAIRLGVLKCWGDGNSMIDGSGNSTSSASPVTPQGFGSGTTAISVGPEASCAVLTGAVKCWGNGEFGQLGNGTKTTFSAPITVTGASAGATAVATNRYVGCAIVSGVVKCWGSNERGILGDGTLIHALTPISVPSLASGVTDISAGIDSSCAVVGGAGKCWGNLDLPTYGDPDETLFSAASPTTVPGLESGVTDIDTSDVGCAVVTATTKCWTPGSGGSPPALSTLTGASSGASAVDVLWSQACTVVSGAAKCGTFASDYALDNHVETVTGLETGVTQVASSGNHDCAIQNGAAKCWGSNYNGALGTGSYGNVGSGIHQVLGLTSGVTAISAGDDFTCAVVSGAAKCWGGDEYALLGDGEMGPSATPVQVEGLTSGVTAISAGGLGGFLGVGHACAVKDGDVYCWGVGEDGETGDNTRFGSTVPIKATNLPSTVTQVSAGLTHNCAIAGGAVYCWGANMRGQLGVGTTIGLKTATDVAAPGDEPSIGFVEPGDQIITGTSVNVSLASANATSIQCKLDDGAWDDCPSSYSNLSQGGHKIRAYAENAAGQLTIADAYFTIDTVAPQVTIVSPANGSIVTTSTPAFYFEVDDPDYNYWVECTLDGKELLGEDYDSCDALEQLPALTVGTHTLVVTTTDPWGNSSSATSTFTYKAPTAPQLPAKPVPAAKSGLTGKAKKLGKSLKVGYEFTFKPPVGTAFATSCSGSVKFTAKFGKKKQTKTGKLGFGKNACRAKVSFKIPSSAARKKVTFDSYFAGNSVYGAVHDVRKLKIKK
jgi:alpha-tubulin suppressor-like RCC1 family protein